MSSLRHTRLGHFDVLGKTLLRNIRTSIEKQLQYLVRICRTAQSRLVARTFHLCIERKLHQTLLPRLLEHASRHRKQTLQCDGDL